MASSTKRVWKLQEFVAHGASVHCLALGKKSGRVMVTGGEDKKVNLWAVGKPNCIMSLTGHTTSVECVKFSHLEDMVCAGSMSGALKIWDLEAAKIVRTLTGHKSSVKCLDFHPYGDFIASGSLDTNIKLWDIRRKGCIYTYKGHSKTVNSLKFSPDGRWIASGGDDGTVKLWDLPAGKMLNEFRGHTGSVSDVDFHPNEFLLASGSSDRTVKFWDLESFQLVTSTEGDSAPVRCIYFNPEGECLFSGAQDLLKVYGWEPARTFDTLVMGWGKVTDIAASQNQLIAGAFSLTSVSIYVVDLKRVQPFGQMGPSVVITPSPFSPGGHFRKSFVKNRHSRKSQVEMKVAEEDSSTPDEQSDDAASSADIKDQHDYNEIFHPRRELTRTPPKVEPFPSPPEDSSNQSSDVQSVLVPKCELPPFDPPVEMPNLLPNKEKKTLVSSSITVTEPTLNTTYTKLSDQKTTQISSNSPVVVTAVKPVEKPAVLRHNIKTFDSSTISIVRPVPVVEKEVKPQRAVIYPERQAVSNFIDFIPDQRERPAGLDLEEFLPKHLQNSFHHGIQTEHKMSEAEAMSIIIGGHQSMMTAMTYRKKNLQIILAQWKTKGMKIALESAIHMNDSSILVDILNVVTLKPSLWNLDMCQILLPAISNLLQSKYEAHMMVGCAGLKLILKNFAIVIKTNITAPPGIGVDITREERYNKCMSCYNQLLSIRAFILKRQTLQGKLGQSFRELHILMRSLE